MAEGARLESVCARKGTVGSNPTPSVNFLLVDGGIVKGRTKISPFTLVNFGFAKMNEWKGGRAVEGARLESEYTLTGIAGSNPALSVLTLFIPFQN